MSNPAPQHPGYQPYYPPQKKGGGMKTFLIVVAAIVVGGLILMGGCIALIGSAADDASDGSVATDSGGNGGNGGGGGGSQAGLGDPVRDGKFEFTVRNIKTGVKSIGKGFMAEKPQGQYVLVRVTVENIGNEAQHLAASDQYLYDSAGKEYSADDGAWIVMKSNPLLEQINPGNKVKGTIVFDVPKKMKPASLELHDSPFSGGVTVSLK